MPMILLRLSSLCFSDGWSCQGTLHHVNQLSGSDGLLEKGEGTQAQRLSLDIRPAECRDNITGNPGRALASAKTPRPLNIGIRRSVITKSNRFSESASFCTTTTGSNTPVTCMPSLASTLVIARSIPGSSSTTKTAFSCNSSIIFSKDSPAPRGKSRRCNDLRHKPIQPYCND